jgi:hypothetical protein
MKGDVYEEELVGFYEGESVGTHGKEAIGATR